MIITENELKGDGSLLPAILSYICCHNISRNFFSSFLILGTFIERMLKGFGVRKIEIEGEERHG